MKTKDLHIGDIVKIKNSITGTIMEITNNGWIKVCWMFVNNGKFISVPDREMQIDGFRAKDVERIIKYA